MAGTTTTLDQEEEPPHQPPSGKKKRGRRLGSGGDGVVDEQAEDEHGAGAAGVQADHRDASAAAAAAAEAPDANKKKKIDKGIGGKKKRSKRALKREQQAAAELEEERRLTSLLFGGGEAGGGGFNRSSRAASAAKTKETSTGARHGDEEVGEGGVVNQKQHRQSEPLFQIDRTGEEGHHHAFADVQEFNDDEEEGVDGASDGEGLDEDSSSDKPAAAAAALSKDEASPAWVDDDDGDLEVDLLGTNRLRKLRHSRTEAGASALSGRDLESRLRDRFRTTTQLTARTDWARVDSDGAVAKKDDSDELAATGPESTSEPLLLGSASGSGSRTLPPTTVNMVRCKDANQPDPNRSVVQAVHFHPGSSPDRPLLLTAGLDKTLRFFQVNGGDQDSEDPESLTASVKVHGIHFPKLPIYSAAFLGSTGNVVVSGRRPFFYVYDAASGSLDLIPKIVGREEKSLEKFAASPDGRTVAFVGNDGYVILFDCQRRHWIADLKMNGSVRALAFSPDGQQLLSSGSDGEVYRWDLRYHSKSASAARGRGRNQQKLFKCIERFPNEDGTITSSMAVSARHVAVGSESGVGTCHSV